MNIFLLHSAPETLKFFNQIQNNVPTYFWRKFSEKPEELKKREKYIAKDPHYSYLYARDFLKGPFPAGEEAIATDSYNAYVYARDVLKKDFYLDGKLIAKAE